MLIYCTIDDHPLLTHVIIRDSRLDRETNDFSQYFSNNIGREKDNIDII